MASNDQGSLLLRKQLMGSYMNFFVKLFSCFVLVCVGNFSFNSAHKNLSVGYFKCNRG